MAYLFEPDVLAQIVRMHLALPIEQQIEAVGKTLREVYGQHVTPGQRWMWSNAGGIMSAISPLHVSHNEYLLFCGTAIGTEGHSGRHRADLFDIVMAGELWTYQVGKFDRHVHRAGEVAHLPRGSSNGSNLRPGVWLLEYARGNIPSLFPFAMGDALFSTLDHADLFQHIGVSTRLAVKEALLFLEERKRGQRFRPNLDALSKPASPAPKKTKRTGRANVN
jgi:C-8 sterol isomerase